MACAFKKAYKVAEKAEAAADDEDEYHGHPIYLPVATRVLHRRSDRKHHSDALVLESSAHLHGEQ